MAMFTAAFDMGLVTGAAAFGFVAERFGYGAMFVTAAAVLGAGTAAFFVLDPRSGKQRVPNPRHELRNVGLRLPLRRDGVEQLDHDAAGPDAERARRDDVVAPEMRTGTIGNPD